MKRRRISRADRERVQLEVDKALGGLVALAIIVILIMSMF